MQHQYLSSMLHPNYIFKLSRGAYPIKKTELMEVGNREKKVVPFHHLPCPLITTYSKLIQLPNILLFNIIQANSRLIQASLHVMSKNGFIVECSPPLLASKIELEQLVCYTTIHSSVD